MASNTRFMNPSTIAKPGGYSHVVEITGPARIVYIAGQLGLKPNGDIAGDFRAGNVRERRVEMREQNRLGPTRPWRLVRRPN